MSSVPLDDLVLHVQRRLDRLVRRLRLGRPPAAARRRLLVVQIDGLSRSVFEEALAAGHLPFLARLIARHRFTVHPMSVGLPTTTAAFQMAALYGVRPDIPGFHYHDKRRRSDVYFPRRGDAALVEEQQTAGRRGALAGGSAYGCTFTAGAANNFFSLTMIKRPLAAGLLPLISAFVVFGWVVAKGLVLSSVQLLRAVLRFVADPVREGARGWKRVALMKLGISVWLRQFFTLAAARDLYAGVPAVFVNYLDYDLFGHAFGPRDRRTLDALRRVDGSIRQLWRVARRVPEHQYDLFVLSDHGQVASLPYHRVVGGRALERVLYEEFFAPIRLAAVTPSRPGGRRLATGIKAFRRGREPGVLQRFVNYLENDFPWVLGEEREAFERDGVRIISAGPNAFVYFLEDEGPLALETIDERFPGLADEISASAGIGLVLVRSASGPVCITRRKRSRLGQGEPGPFAGRADLDLVIQGIRDLMAMPSAGDLVIYGTGASEGDVSYIPELGAHAGPSAEEMQTFILAPPGVDLPAPITHPSQLYPVFAHYQEAETQRQAAA
jgi:hypothetical protein